MKKLMFMISLLPFISCGQPQQEADMNYEPVIEKPLFEEGKGPVMLIDGGHNNFHTADGKFTGFAKVARADGFQVKTWSGAITQKALQGVKLLVIANALHIANQDNWKLPVHSAFTTEEARLIQQWVSEGGRLFLIADHMPFAGATEHLAAAFGYTFYNGFAMSGPGKKYDIFSVENKLLKPSEVTDKPHSVKSVITYTGQAFKIPEMATSVLSFDEQYKVLLPQEAWKFSKDMDMMPANGLSQLAYSTYGNGKVVVAGEAAMFTAQQIPGVVKFGLNSDMPNDNLSLLLNLFDWLMR